jgi:CCR4-NOT transcription complex subunit 1
VKQTVDKISLLQRVLIVASQILHRDYTQKPNFNQKPYYRFFAELLRGLGTLDPSFEPFLLPILSHIAEVLHHFQPAHFSGFAFAWLGLVAHRSFMPKILKDQKGWPIMQQLLVELFQFLEPYLRTAKLTPAIRLFYKGTLRLLLVFLHDFPEFLCDYHFSFCDVIPTSCLQLRNLILSAFPRMMKLPDPFTPNLKVDLLPEIKEPPHILSNYLQALG